MPLAKYQERGQLLWKVLLHLHVNHDDDDDDDDDDDECGRIKQGYRST